MLMYWNRDRTCLFRDLKHRNFDLSHVRKQKIGNSGRFVGKFMLGSSTDVAVRWIQDLGCCVQK